MKTNSLFGFDFLDIKLADAARLLVTNAEQGIRTRIFFVNPHCVNIAAQDRPYNKALRDADVLFADGSGMKIASKVAGDAFIDNVNGTDLFPVTCELLSQTELKLALLGAKPGVAELCAQKMMQHYPGLDIVWVRDGYFTNEDESEMIQSLNDSGADILYVAMGVPMQELWIAEHEPDIRAPVKLAVGALFDFYSGQVRRAPLVFRRFGMEWVYRLMLEPRRMFTRYVIGNPVFLLRLCARRLRGREAVKRKPLG